MMMGPYTSFLTSLKLYPPRKLASEMTASAQKPSEELSTVKIRTYELYDYRAVGKQIIHLKNYMAPYQQLDLKKDKLIGHGVREEKDMGRYNQYWTANKTDLREHAFGGFRRAYCAYDGSGSDMSVNRIPFTGRDSLPKAVNVHSEDTVAADTYRSKFGRRRITVSNRHVRRLSHLLHAHVLPPTSQIVQGFDAVNAPDADVDDEKASL
jgi:hypothetical protein